MSSVHMTVHLSPNTTVLTKAETLLVDQVEEYRKVGEDIFPPLQKKKIIKNGELNS